MVFAAMVAIWGCNIVASPIEDLASPSQEVRDAAAKLLRSSYTPPARTNWNSLIDSIKVGDSKTNVIEMLRRLGTHEEMSAGTGTYESRLFPLDDLWQLELASEGDRVVGRKVREQMRSVSVVPPTNYTGVWTTYWVNGQRQSEVDCRDGKYSGTLTAFYPNGTNAYVQHYEQHNLEGTYTSYFLSGRVKSWGQFRTNTQVGIWVSYKEDGSTNFVEVFSNP